MNFTELLRGKKTYLVAVLAVIYLFGGDQGWWQVNAEIMGIFGAAGLATLRAGIKGDSGKPPEPPSTGATPAVVLALCLGTAAIMQTGCKSVDPGNDPVVVRAEQVTQVALETFDAFLEWEWRNRNMGLSLSSTPEVAAAAAEIRANGIRWLEDARALTQAYKEHRTPERRANLETAIAVLQETISRVSAYLP